jgi:peptide chain release factor 2
MNLKPEDLEVSTYPPYKTGGQHVGLTHSGVLIVHIPTGLGVVSTTERSQYRNKERALTMLEILVELEGVNAS